MNESFINIKVDREERPDLDRQYMMYVQATTGSGGWPLNVFLSPDLIPIFGGTYFAPRDDSIGGRPSFKSILEAVSQRWKNDWKTLERNGRNLVEQLKKAADIVPTGSDHGGNVVRIKSIQKAFLHLQQTFDSQFGGFGSGTKFPMPGTVGMLLRYWSLWKDLDRDAQTPSLAELRQNFEGVPGDEATLKALWKETVQNGMSMASEARGMVYATLKRIARGGIHDHVAGGFHRYSVDRAWTLPHFEKMLYDQAQLIKLYSEAFLVFDRDPEFEAVVLGIINYVKERLLCSESGAFYSAEDADSLNPKSGKIEEGAFAVWSDEEVNDLLKSQNWSIEDIKAFKYHYTILPRGNLFNLTPDSHLKQSNVLIERTDSSVTAEKLARPRGEIDLILRNGIEILKKKRLETRPMPHRDEKIIAAWNGLMLSCLSVASKAFDNEEYLKLAERLADFIKTKFFYKDSEGNLRLWRSIFGGKPSGINAFSDDYASIIAGLIELHQATFDSEYLDLAEQLQSTLNNLYRDKAGGGFYDSLADSNGLFRIKDDHDAVEPSSNSLTALNCLKLNLLTGKKVYMEIYKQIIRLFTKRLDKEPQGMTTLISAIIMDSAKPILLTLTDSERKELILEALNKNFLPHLLVKIEKEEEGAAVASKSIGHICKSNVCSAPISEPDILLKQLGI